MSGAAQLDPASPFTEVLLAAMPSRAGVPVADMEPGDLAAVRDAIAALARGDVVVVLDDADRENEGDLILAAEFANPDKLSFLLRHTSGVLCCALTGAQCDALDLPPMVPSNTDAMGTAFTVSVDARADTTTGISAADRATTIRALADPSTRPADLARPGHVFPLRARDGGVLTRAGHTEAAVDLARLAGLQPAGVICEVVTADKSGMARGAELRWLAARYDLPLITVADLIRYRLRSEKLVQRTASAWLPTAQAEFIVHAYASEIDGREHLALVCGDVASAEGRPAESGVPNTGVLVRLHSECLTGDVLASQRCDCGRQLTAAMEAIAREGRGVIVYNRGHEGRGIGLASKIAAYALQDEGLDTVDANVSLGLPVDARTYDTAAQILWDLGVAQVRLLTNNPDKLEALATAGLSVVTRTSLVASAHPAASAYLETKRTRMGHLSAAEAAGDDSSILAAPPPVYLPPVQVRLRAAGTG